MRGILTGLLLAWQLITGGCDSQAPPAKPGNEVDQEPGRSSETPATSAKDQEDQIIWRDGEGRRIE
jgi:hypothetical protein